MNKFTETATGALNLALECARELGHSFIGSQHLLFGLAAQEGGLSQSLLRQVGADADTVVSLIERQDGRGARSAVAPCDLTPRSKRIIESSYAVAASFATTISAPNIFCWPCWRRPALPPCWCSGSLALTPSAWPQT